MVLLVVFFARLLRYRVSLFNSLFSKENNSTGTADHYLQYTLCSMCPFLAELLWYLARCLHDRHLLLRPDLQDLEVRITAARWVCCLPQHVRFLFPHRHLSEWLICQIVVYTPFCLMIAMNKKNCVIPYFRCCVLFSENECIGQPLA